MQSLIRCPITRYSTINLSNPLFIFDFWKLDSFLAQLTELSLSFCRRQWNNFEKSKCMGREYNRCLLVKKYSPSLVFTNMSFTDGRRWSQNGLRWILLRTSASRAGCQGLWLVNNSAYGFGNARIYMRRRALGRDWVNKWWHGHANYVIQLCRNIPFYSYRWNAAGVNNLPALLCKSCCS